MKRPGARLSLLWRCFSGATFFTCSSNVWFNFVTERPQVCQLQTTATWLLFEAAGKRSQQERLLHFTCFLFYSISNRSLGSHLSASRWRNNHIWNRGTTRHPTWPGSVERPAFLMKPAESELVASLEPTMACISIAGRGRTFSPSLSLKAEAEAEAELPVEAGAEWRLWIAWFGAPDST